MQCLTDAGPYMLAPACGYDRIGPAAHPVGHPAPPGRWVRLDYRCDKGHRELGAAWPHGRGMQQHDLVQYTAHHRLSPPITLHIIDHRLSHITIVSLPLLAENHISLDRNTPHRNTPHRVVKDTYRQMPSHGVQHRTQTIACCVMYIT